MLPIPPPPPPPTPQVPSLDDEGVAKGVAMKSGGESSMKLDWPSAALPSYVSGKIQDSPKMVVLLELIFHSVHVGEKILVFR